MCGITGGGAPAQAPAASAAPAAKGDATQTGVAGATGGGAGSIASILEQLAKSISAISQALNGSSILGGGAPAKGNPMQLPGQAGVAIAIPVANPFSNPLSNPFDGLPGSPAATHTGPLPAGVMPLVAPPSALVGIAPPAGSPPADPSGGKNYYFQEIAGPKRIINVNEATVRFYGLKPAS